MTKVTLDTNVYISALFWKGAPHEVFQKILKGEIVNYVSLSILQEIEKTLLGKFEVPREQGAAFLESIVYGSEVIHPSLRLNVVNDDPADNKILECALEADASFVITGDQHLLKIKTFRSIPIVTPQQFLSSVDRLISV